MSEITTLDYIIHDQFELNLSYMPFIIDGGLFIPTTLSFTIGDLININLQLPGESEPKPTQGRVVWITPKNALYQIYQGIGVQLVGDDTKSIRDQIAANIDNSMDVGGYTYGLSNEENKSNETENK